MTMRKTEKLEIRDVYRCLQLENEEDREYFRQLARVGQKGFEEEKESITFGVTRHNTQTEEGDA